MAKLKLSFDIDENLLAFEINKQISKQLNSILFSMKNDGILKAQINDFIDRQIRTSIEFSELINGELREIFGLTNPDRAVEEIIETVKRSSVIDIQESRIIGKKLTNASITISILRDDFSDVLSLQSASYTSQGGEVNWLDWMLIKGDAIILADYTVDMNNPSSSSRTGGALMVKSNRGFRVPPAYAGNSRANWLTRCFDETEEIVGNLLKVDFLRRLS